MILDTKLSPDAGYALYTYYNYVKAWVINFENTFGAGSFGVDGLLDNMKSSSKIINLRKDARCTNEVRGHYLRGKFTLLLMSELPTNDHPELSISANMWLPVQAYYAINGVGLSLLAILKQKPKDHRAFLSCFANIISQFLPSPLSACCNGGPCSSSFTFTKINTSYPEVARQSNIANPEYSSGDHFIGKSLSTTRDKTIGDLFDKARHKQTKRGNRRNLNSAEKTSICQGLHPTTICDFLYRMRVRSNYENPDMYLFATENVQDAASHYMELLYLTNMLVVGLDCIIERKIGAQEMTNLNNLVSLSRRL